MSENGPIYGVELIDTLPLGKSGMLQAMPTRDDLRSVRCERVAAGYEVLLAHYLELKKRFELTDDVKAAADRLRANNYADSHDTADGYVSEGTDLLGSYDASDLSQPFTVEWLCEIGGQQFASGIVFFESPHGVEFDYWGYQKKWTLDGSTVKTPITTRGDVLAWLNVLGIVPATTKGGDK